MSGYPTIIHERVAQARAGRNPTVISRMPSGWAVLGDMQYLPGYALLLPDPVVTHLTDLDPDDLTRFLLDMARIGAALLEVTDAHRINYEILGNAAPALHAHVFARYPWEPDDRRAAPVWTYHPDTLHSVPFSPDGHGPLRDALARVLAPDGG